MVSRFFNLVFNFFFATPRVICPLLPFSKYLLISVHKKIVNWSLLGVQLWNECEMTDIAILNKNVFFLFNSDLKVLCKAKKTPFSMKYVKKLNFFLFSNWGKCFQISYSFIAHCIFMHSCAEVISRLSFCCHRHRLQFFHFILPRKGNFQRAECCRHFVRHLAST